MPFEINNLKQVSQQTSIKKIKKKIIKKKKLEALALTPFSWLKAVALLA